MFWEAASATGNAVPGSVIQNVIDPTTFNKSHPKKQYPGTGMLPMMPDRVSLKIHLQAIGDDVLEELVASQDLDPAIKDNIARYQLGGAASFDWTPATAKVIDETGRGHAAVRGQAGHVPRQHGARGQQRPLRAAVTTRPPPPPPTRRQCVVFFAA